MARLQLARENPGETDDGHRLADAASLAMMLAACERVAKLSGELVDRAAQLDPGYSEAAAMRS